MPKTYSDYSNTIIYKITCNDVKIASKYVGYTTNFTQRKYKHKQLNTSSKLDTMIKNNGGWTNWTMEAISTIDCKTKQDATKKTREYSELLVCDLLDDVIPIKHTFFCVKCEYGCSKKSDYEKHCNTIKHKDIVLPNVNPELQMLSNMVIELCKSNVDIQKQLIDMCKNGIHKNTVINNTTNSNNKFNINVFLNEQCKDAINFADFVKSIEVSQSDLHNTGQLGFVDGISKIILDNLKQLSVNERPIHCTDIKRETMYIKDEDKWNKEEDDTKLRNAIQTVSRKSMKTLIDWKQVNPDYEDGDSEFSQDCLSMQRHSVAGDDREVYYPKVARLVAKEVMVGKS